jgi:hypothetical protein
MIYTFIIAGGLLSGRITAEKTWLLMAIPCIAPMLWCALGVMRGLGNTGDAGEAEAGLVLSAVGWLFLATGLVLKYVAIQRALPDAYASEASSPATPLCIGLAVLCLLLGAALSWVAWVRDEE